MSKEEWEDVHESGGEEEEEDPTIANPNVVMKYKKAAQWANEALADVIAKTTVGATVLALCECGDAAIMSRAAKAFRGVDKGIAFPTCVSLNHCVCHNSPVPGEVTTAEVLAEGDVVHIDLGAHIDGYCAVVAHTIVVTSAAELADDRTAQVVAAAAATLQTALRCMRPGTSAYDVTDIIEGCAKHFGLTVVDGVLSHMIKRYIVDGFRCIAGKRVSEQLVHDYPLEAGQVWTLDIALTTGKGKLRERDTRCAVFKAALETSYASKMQSAREVQGEVNDKFQTFPFAVRNITHKKVRLGLSEMVKHGVVVPYPVLYEREGEVVAHFKVTLFITAKKIDRITGLPPQKSLAAIPPFTDPALLFASKQTLTLERKGGKDAPAPASVPAPAPAAE